MPSTPSAPPRLRSTIVAFALLASTLAAVGTVATMGPARAAAPVPAAPTPPVWAVETGAGAAVSLSTDFLGNTWVASTASFLTQHAPDGTVRGHVDVSGTGTIRAYAGAIDATQSLVAEGVVTGSVTLGTGAAATVLDGGAGSYFLARFDAAGQPVWTRLLGANGSYQPNKLAFSGTAIALVGTFTTSFTIDATTVSSPGNGRAAFVAQFDATTSALEFLRPITPPDANNRVFAYDVTMGRTGHTIVAGFAVNVGGAPLTLTTPGVASLPCPSGACGYVADMTASNGDIDQLYTVGDGPTAGFGVAANDERVAVQGNFSTGATIGHGAGAVTLPTAPAVPGAFTAEFDVNGAIQWAVATTATGYVDGGYLAIDRANGVLATAHSVGTATIRGSNGSVAGSSPSTDAIIIGSYDSAGALRSYDVITGIGSGTAGIAPVQLDAAGTARLTIAHDHDLAITTTAGPVNLTGAGTALVAFAATAPMPGGGFHGLPPARVLDSRTATGGWDAPLTSTTPKDLTLGGVAGVPVSAAAVVVNVTVTQSSTASFLTVYPTGLPTPNASNLNFGPGQTVSNLVTVPLGVTGRVSFATALGTTHVVADVVGYYDTDATKAAAGTAELFRASGPTRILDSRTATGGWNAPLGPGATRDLPVAGSPGSGVPATATSVALALAGTQGTANTFVRVFPAGSPTPDTSNLLVGAYETTSNLVVTAIGAGGAVTFSNEHGTIELVADVVGYFDPVAGGGSSFHPVPPTRVLDDRTGLGGFATPWGPGTARDVPVAGQTIAMTTIFAGATSISGNLTATNGTTGSFLTMYPGGASTPSTSTLLFAPFQTVPTMVLGGLGTGGATGIANQLGTVDVILDVNGYYTTP